MPTRPNGEHLADDVDASLSPSSRSDDDLDCFISGSKPTWGPLTLDFAALAEDNKAAMLERQSFADTRSSFVASPSIGQHTPASIAGDNAVGPAAGVAKSCSREEIALHQLFGAHDRLHPQEPINELSGAPVLKLTPAQLNFRVKLGSIKLKAIELFSAGHKEAGDAAIKLYTELDIQSTHYFKGHVAANYFRDVCGLRMTEAHAELDEHRGWAQVLGNLALAIVGLGVGYVVAGLINKAATGRFLFFKTNFEQRFDALQQSIDQVAPAG